MDTTPDQTTSIDLSISYGKASLLGVLIPLPIVAVFLLAYMSLWNTSPLAEIMTDPSSSSLLLALIIGGAVIHEFIHGLTWAIAGKKSMRTIRYGIHWKSLSAYANCTEPIIARAYKMGGYMPFLAEGIVPSLLALVTGSAWLFIFGAIFIMGAGGDLLVMWIIRTVKPESLVLDHPTRVGCSVFISTPPEGVREQ